MEKDILEILEKNSRISFKDISNMLGTTEENIEKTVKKLENNKTICGYTTLINWDKTDKEGDYITSLIEVKVTPQREQGFDKIAKRIYSFDEVKSLYLMSGTFDLLIVVEGKNIKDISSFVSSKLATLDCIISTSTHFVLKKYKDHGVIIDENTPNDERIIVTP
ncbi:Lrp/AsnC family transcriptional regulator [[Clostridium] colinum]|uniref:Lrp/AsnC family transcriptional regulator n=1 Tax=[Clostridium] colinum TaxID=36835 RepID=UPI0020253723|nr:Lrp/AsnC family transcriptional regulator [[Clostridium] colinum]